MRKVVLISLIFFGIAPFLTNNNNANAGFFEMMLEILTKESSRLNELIMNAKNKEEITNALKQAQRVNNDIIEVTRAIEEGKQKLADEVTQQSIRSLTRSSEIKPFKEFVTEVAETSAREALEAGKKDLTEVLDFTRKKTIKVIGEEDVKKLHNFEFSEIITKGTFKAYDAYEAQESGKLRNAIRFISEQLTKSRTPWKPVVYALRFGKFTITIIGRAVAGAQIAYEFTVFDENAQKKLSNFSIVRTPDQLLELLDFPSQQVKDLREFAQYSPLREMSKTLQKAKDRQQGDFTKDKIAIIKEINDLKNCLHYEGTTRVCILKHGFGELIFKSFIDGLFGSKKPAPPSQEILYLNKPNDIIKIKNQIDILEERYEVIDERAKKNYEKYRKQEQTAIQKRAQLREQNKQSEEY
ncbi:MAG: hypothetical protein AAB847_01345 [Patescibacteria group bacterium]